MVAIHDREARDRATATYAPDQLGRTQYMTPEGYLLCEGVRIARTGPMLYRHEEMPELEPNPNGQMLVVDRDEDVLFAPETLLSAAGKPVSNEHPGEMVTPVTFQGVSCGVMLNPRRGEGIEASYMVADLLITEPGAIEDVRKKRKREVSLGYDAEVEQISPGHGRQTKVTINHVALVKQGRAGPNCAIQDEEPVMAKKPRTFIDRIRTAIKAKDEAAIEQELNAAQEAMDDDEGDPQTLVIKIEQAPAAAATTPDPVIDEADPTEERFKKIEGALETIAAAVAKLAAPADPDPVIDESPDGDELDEEKKEVEKTAVSDAIAKAEILAPGIRLPKFDSANPAIGSRITDLRRESLKVALTDSAKKVHVEAVMGGRDLAKMRPSQVAVVFDAAAALAKASNNQVVLDRGFIPQGPMTAAKMQERILERRKATS